MVNWADFGATCAAQLIEAQGALEGPSGLRAGYENAARDLHSELQASGDGCCGRSRQNFIRELVF